MQGPCGGVARAGRTYTSFSPGVNTIVLAEAIYHAGSPWSIQLALNNDTTVYTLLDHIPQDEQSFFPTKDHPHLVRVDLVIPDIACQDCSLIMYNPMVRAGQLCSRQNANCSAYHSCANIKITGAQNPQEWAQSFTYNVPGWPYVSTPGVYSFESAPYNGSFPARYATQQTIGPCANYKWKDGKHEKHHPEGREWPEYIWSVIVMIFSLLSR